MFACYPIGLEVLFEINDYNMPLPQDMECSKLDWLLQINEEYFEEQLRTVVSGFLFIAYVPLLISSYSTNVNVLKT